MAVAGVVLADQPSGLAAAHRGGQTFITWQEDTATSGEGYHVYRHSQPITAASLRQAERLTATWGPWPEGSSAYFTERDREVEPSAYPGLRNYVIEALGAELADNVGLLVWTPAQTGSFYYAVTTVVGDLENRTDFGPGNTLYLPVAESVADPEPVLVWEGQDGTSRVYTQFMDLASFNPTFERPHQGLAFAYNYWVGLPTAAMCGGVVPPELPLYLQIEGHGSRYRVFDASPWGWCAATIIGDDPRQSWYFGFSATFDFRADSGGPPDTGPIANFTEERLLRAIWDTVRDPLYGIDPDRVYAYGHSMGGSGALALGMRYPNVFAAVYACQPMTDYATSGDDGGTNWRADCVAKWGSLDANLPVAIRGRFATHLAAWDGTGVWDWQNHQQQLVSRRGDDMAHLSLAHGSLDRSIEWLTQGRPVYEALYLSRRAFSGVVEAEYHTWMGFAGLGPNLEDHAYRGPFYGFEVRRDETVPGLSYDSGSSPAPPPAAVATYNMKLAWSASWRPWDGPPVDTAELWRISLRTTGGWEQTVDVTPRRLQRFRVLPGAEYAWENRQVDGDSLVASGTVTADADGLVTVPAFAVTPEGNRLLLRPVDGSSPPPRRAGGRATPNPTQP